MLMERDNQYLKGNKFAKGNRPNSSTFKKGNTPWNRGTKGVMKANSGTFKKGQKAVNWKPINTITTRIEKKRTQRKYIKVAEPNIWVQYSIYLWEQEYGQRNEKQKKMVIHHIDFDSLNDVIENLVLITRREHLNIHRKNLKERGKPN